MEKLFDPKTGKTLTDALPQPQKARTSDVVIGVLLGLDTENTPLVAFPQSPSKLGVTARALVELSEDDVGCEVALLFERGDPAMPLILGRVREPAPLQPVVTKPLQAQVDGESLVLNAEKDIVLKCGKASITLTRAGKVLIRGTYILSRSTGANRIKGGSINLN